MPWYRRVARWGQTTLTEVDPARFDLAFWRDYWRRTRIQGVIVNAGGIVDVRIRPAEPKLVSGLRCLPSPGHTPGVASLIFPWRGGRTAICGDAVMAEDHFRAREGHHNSVDFPQAMATIDLHSAEADIVVPGHGAAFDVGWRERGH